MSKKNCAETSIEGLSDKKDPNHKTFIIYQDGDDLAISCIQADSRQNIPKFKYLPVVFQRDTFNRDGLVSTFKDVGKTMNIESFHNSIKMSSLNQAICIANSILDFRDGKSNRD